VGTSGWQYRDWRGEIYPRDQPPRRWLSLYAEMFDTVELNSSFYRLPTRAQFEAWAAATPDGFQFAVKASRYLTHLRRLRDPKEPVERLLGAANGLGTKLGPVLVQLPPTLRVDCEALDETLTAFGNRARVAVEFRDESWDCDEVDAVLVAHGSTRVVADHRSAISGHPTSDWTYVRLHHGRAIPTSSYGKQALRTWASRINNFPPDAYVYFNNDAHGCAAHNALTLRNLLYACR
jgi:uncharacterized protein YecE (DUF72 family)